MEQRHEKRDLPQKRQRGEKKKFLSFFYASCKQSIARKGGSKEKRKQVYDIST